MTRVDIPVSIHDAVDMLMVLDAMEGDKLMNRDKLHGVIHYLKQSAAPLLYHELRQLVTLLEPLERDGRLPVPGLATLNGARRALAIAQGKGGEA